MSLPNADLLLLIQRRLASVAVRRSGLAFCLFGEAGIGKTSAVTQLLKNVPYQFALARAVTPVAQVFQLLPRPKRIPSWLKAKLDKDLSLETLLGLLEVNAPFVLLVEDWHEASAAAQDFWLRLALAAQHKKGLGVILTSRVAIDSGLESWRLLPLDLLSSTALLQAEVGAVLPEEATAWIFTKAAGNPLFTLEFFRHLARQGLLWNDTKRWHWREPPADAMPITVEALIEQLLFDPSDSLPSRLALQARALLEIRVPQLMLDANLWAQVAGLDVSALEFAELHLRRRGILSQSGFVHPLFREVTFKQLSSSERAELATRALQVLQVSHPEFAAEFLLESQLPPETALHVLLSCAKALEAQPTRAAQLKAKAAQFLVGVAKANLLLEAIGVLVHSEPKEALGYAEVILELPDLPEATRIDAIYFATSAIVTTTRNIVAAETSLVRLPEVFQNDTRYISSYLGFLMMCGQPARALELWEAHLELHDVVETPVLIHVLSALVLTGQMQQAQVLSLSILRHPKLLPREKMSVLNIRAISLAQLGQLEASEKVALEAIALAEQLEQHNAVGAMLFNRAVTLERTMQRDLMRDHATRALVALEKAGNFGLAAQAQLMLANFDFETGAYDRAEELLNTAYTVLKQGAETPFLVAVELSLVRFHLQRQLQYSQTLSLKYARDALRHATSLGQQKLVASSQTHLCLALLQTEQVKEARDSLEAALPVLLGVSDSNSFYVLSAEAKLLEAEQQNVVLAWQTAVARAEELGFLFDAYCYRLELARVEKNIVAAQEAVLWFTEQGLLHGVYLAQQYFGELKTTELTSNQTTGRLEVLGTMQISSAGVISAVKGQKRKELLAVLLEARIAGRSEVKTLELIDALYPHSLEEEAQVSLRQTVFKTRAAHGGSIISTTANGYALGGISSDAEEFLATKNTQLWRGTYFDGLSASEEIREMLTWACQNQSQHILETNPKEVARVMRILLESDPYDLVTLKMACNALRSDNNHRTLQRVYSDTRAKLLEVGEVLPERWQEFLV
jgi:tetratricopeptide (TPR) repeat protein